MQSRIAEASVEFIPRTLRVPMRLSSGLITEVTEARARVTVEVGGRQATGQGAIYLSDLWSWPDSSLTHAARDVAMRRCCVSIAEDLIEMCGGKPAHPTELGLRLHERLQADTESPVRAALARAVCGSPFDAAIHDAAGHALECSAFSFYDEPAPLPAADAWFPREGTSAAIAQVLLKPPRTYFDAWLCISQNDSLDAEVAPWIRERGYRCFKLKLSGKDSTTDVARTMAVYHRVLELGADKPRLSVDTNEGNPDAASVLEYLERLRADDPDAFAALEYLEQPTSRDILRYPQDWRSVARLKPVILDEGLIGMETLPEVLAQGWSGIAIKTCKGHSFSLAAAAWAGQRGLLISLQDLTNPGVAAIHSALLAAHVPTINGIELNSPQYTPDANADWLPRLSALLEPKDGTHHLPETTPIGLGSDL